MCEICLPRKNRSYFWARCSSTHILFKNWMCELRIFFDADAIITSSISQSWISVLPRIDCDVLDSSIDFALSTSVIHDIVIWGFGVFAQTSVLKLTFQLSNSMESGNFARCSSEIATTTSRKPLKWRRNYLRWRRKYLHTQAVQKLKQNQEDLNLLLAHLQELYLFVKEYGLILNQELNLIKRTQWQNEYKLFFDTENYLEKKMVRSNSGDWKMIFRTNMSIPNVGLLICGRARWQEAEATRKAFNIALIHQDEKFFTSELFKVIQDAIPLILHCRTMC